MIINKNYMEISLEGSAYEIGKKLGYMASQSDDFKFFVTNRPDFASKFSSETIKKIVSYFEKHCPNVNREIEGMAEVLSIKPEDICYYLWTYKFRGSCSHFALNPKVTENGHTLIGRNYEFNHDMTDCMFMDIKEDGYARNMGFSSVIFGRIDGLNEHGLAMTMTGGIPPLEDNYADGFMFWAVIRKVLDNCKDIYEAWEVIRSMKSGCNPTYMVGDRNGKLMLVEQTPEKIERKVIDDDSAEFLLADTNHFNLESMIPHRKHFFRQSLVRYENILNTFGSENGKYKIEDMKNILTTEYPQGLNAPYFSEYFGSLWSSIYNCSTGETEVRMGNTEKEWHKHSFSNPLNEGVRIHEIELKNENAPSEFWEFIK